MFCSYGARRNALVRRLNDDGFKCKPKIDEKIHKSQNWKKQRTHELPTHFDGYRQTHCDGSSMLIRTEERDSDRENRFIKIELDSPTSIQRFFSSVQRGKVQSGEIEQFQTDEKKIEHRKSINSVQLKYMYEKKFIDCANALSKIMHT